MGSYIMRGRCRFPIGSIIRKIREVLEKYELRFSEINQKICSNPELAFEEHDAHDNICAFFDSLAAEGYTVKRHAYGVKTAFEVSYTHGPAGRVVAFNAEYDALPGMGHACGHNLIATSAIASCSATTETMKTLYSDAIGFTVRLLGTPAEEGGGGKLQLIEAGAYKYVDACFMVHPFPILPGAPDLLSSGSDSTQYLANSKVEVTYTGKPAHASAAPWEGVNALDAVVSAYKIHGVVLRGGERPNVIPAFTTVEYFVRSPTKKTLEPLTERVLKCFDAAAAATGCDVEYNWEPSYLDMKVNKPISDSYTSAMNAMGYKTISDAAGQDGGLSGGSTDMAMYPTRSLDSTEDSI
ncbi:hypothetical protein N7486_001199 [Penicillium sp. IBT 16267x]|nr:hypothetical protein N7486_001199 [Penicillium sp. IBT 16267x]